MNFIPIIYENNEILVINKPAGMSVQGGEKISHPLDEELSKQVGYKIFLVHRLDRDTSGLMVVAKSSAAAAKWIKLIAGKQVKKEYKAICIGLPKGGKTGIITENIEKGGKEKSAFTEYRVEKTFFAEKKEGDGTSEKIPLSLIHLKLGTGRMHQIRIHLAKSGCPIAGDDKHGNFKVNKSLRKIAGVKILQLCSFKLSLSLEGKNKVFEIELPPHMQALLQNPAGNGSAGNDSECNNSGGNNSSGND